MHLLGKWGTVLPQTHASVREIPEKSLTRDRAWRKFKPIAKKIDGAITIHMWVILLSIINVLGVPLVYPGCYVRPSIFPFSSSFLHTTNVYYCSRHHSYEQVTPIWHEQWQKTSLLGIRYYSCKNDNVPNDELG